MGGYVRGRAEVEAREEEKGRRFEERIEGEGETGRDRGSWRRRERENMMVGELWRGVGGGEGRRRATEARECCERSRMSRVEISPSSHRVLAATGMNHIDACSSYDLVQ